MVEFPIWALEEFHLIKEENNESSNRDERYAPSQVRTVLFSKEVVRFDGIY